MTPSKSDRIAISAECFPRSLKQRLLFFDRIGVIEPEAKVRWLHLKEMQYKNQDVAINLANDLEFLQKENIVIDVTPYHLMAGWLTQLSTQLERVRGDENSDDPLSMGGTLEGFYQLAGRRCARYMQDVKGLNASALLSEPLFWIEGLEESFTESSADIIEVVRGRREDPHCAGRTAR